jgi:hypothetical protein
MKSLTEAQLYADDAIVLEIYECRGDSSIGIFNEMTNVNSRVSNEPGKEDIKGRNPANLIYICKPTYNQKKEQMGALLVMKSGLHLIAIKKYFHENFNTLNIKGWRLWASEKIEKPKIRLIEEC